MKIAAVTIVVLLLAVGGFLVFRKPKSTPIQPPLISEIAEQLPVDKQPKISLSFSSDSHYVTVDISNIYAAQLEYNLIYDAKVKGNQIQTGVNAAAKLDGKTEYSQKQLLGSESSGKFTYHANIDNAVMELTLRDSANRSIFSSSYPFTVASNATIDL